MHHQEIFFVPGYIYEGTETVLEAAVEEAEAMGRGWTLLDDLPVTKIPKWRLIYQVRRMAPHLRGAPHLRRPLHS